MAGNNKVKGERMGTYKIIYSKKECIGAGECQAISPELWKVLNDGKAEMKNAKLNSATGKYELEIDESMFKKQQQVAGSCPAGCIKIEKSK
jgi:ferredoxin